MAIITTTEYKAWADITDAGFDTRLDIIIPSVQAELEAACSRVFDSTAYTDELHDGNGERSVWLSNAPVTAMAAVKLRDSNGVDATQDATSYRWTADGELRRLTSDSFAWNGGQTILGVAVQTSIIWPDDVENIVISYTGGYVTAPANLKLLMYRLVDAAFDNAGENWVLGASGDGVISKTYLNAAEMASKHAQLIAPWRSRVVV